VAQMYAIVIAHGEHAAPTSVRDIM
jgi:hypothetical protein